jgi:lambda family phage portal protein
MSRVLSFIGRAANAVAPEVPPHLKQRRYDAASRTSRMSGWYTPTTDADAAISDPITIRNRARDLVRNNPWASKGVNVCVNNAIGYGIRAQIKAGSALRTRQAQALWQRHMETSACDADGMHDIYGLQQLAFRALVESGECLIRFRPRRPEDGLPLPFQLQVIEPDLLSDNIADASGVLPGNDFEKGVEYDPLGRRVAYHLFRKHPGSSHTLAGIRETARVPASEIIHLYRKDRPGQNRGVSWLSPVVVAAKNLGLFEDATLQSSMIANLFTGWLHSDDPQAFGEELDEEIPDLQPGTMYALKPGRSVTFNEPPKRAEDPQFRQWILRGIASGLGITYESLTGDMSQVTYSSARMSAHEFGRNVESWQWNLFIPVFCQRVFVWYSDMLAATGVNTDGMTVEWTPPTRTVVDPGKEVAALINAVKGGLMSLPEAIRGQGFDPDAVATEQAEYLAKLDAAGLKVESDYRNAPSVVKQTEEPTPQEETLTNE